MLLSDELAEQLAKLLTGGKLILFAGAGLSLQARHKDDLQKRLPLWNDLANLVAKRCDESLDNYAGNLFDLFDSITRKKSRLELEDAVRQAIPEDEFAPSDIHNTLAQLPWARVYTTNYDNILSRAFSEKKPIVTEEDFEYLGRPYSKQPKLIHLHGTLSNMHTLTGEDYNQWSEKHRRASLKVTMDGLEHCFLFLGYSNSDPHFRHRIIPLINELKTKRGHNNYSWMWQPSEDQIRLLEQRDSIHVHSIANDNEWFMCAEKLRQAYNSLLSATSQKTSSLRKAKVDNWPHDERYSKVKINGYKLFYYRDHSSIARATLARMSNLSVGKIARLEKVDRSKSLGDECFQDCTLLDIWKLEKALGCETSLEFGKKDDFLAYYIEYYKNNWKKRRRQPVPQQRGIFQGKTKAVVFDFGGTLTKPAFRESTWERIWKSVGYSLTDANELHHMYSAGKISHQRWCDLTCKKLKVKGFSKEHFERVYMEIEPITGLEETFRELYEKNIKIAIVSGSMRSIIHHVIGDSLKYVDTIRSNNFIFDDKMKLKRIEGHKYDFAGKAEFIKELAQQIDCHPIDILFVGNSLNDEKAALSGARTLCVNPKHTHFHISSMWNNSIRDMKNLKEILEYV